MNLSVILRRLLMRVLKQCLVLLPQQLYGMLIQSR